MAERPMEHFTVDGVNIFEVTDAKARQDVSDLKDDFHSYHSELGAGYADQLVSSIENTDSVPYNFRKVPYDATLEKVEGIVGVDVVLNQYADNTHLPTDREGITFTHDDNSFTLNGTVTGSNLGAGGWFGITDASNFSNHTVLVDFEKLSGTSSNDSGLMFSAASSNDVINFGCKIHKYGTLTSTNKSSFTVLSGVTCTNLKCRIHVSDLTQTFGSQIADYVYNLETATAGAGVAWLKEHFPKIFNAGYVSYNAGTMVHVSGLSAKRTVGFNQWDEEYVNGFFNDSGVYTARADIVGSKNAIHVLPNTTYCFNGKASAFVTYWRSKVSIDNAPTGEFISREQMNADVSTFTTPADCHYIFLNMPAAYGTTYKNDICINLSDPVKNGTYEPYEVHEYPLDSSIDLHGILKLDSNNKLYADGDVYPPSGEVSHRYAITVLDGSSGTFSMPNTNQFNIDNALESYKISTRAITYISSRYVALPQISSNSEFITLVGTGDKVFDLSSNTTGNTIRIYDKAYTTIDAFKASLASNPLTVVYELATPTTETAEPYTATQICDPKGTEEYISETVAPVGHTTKYLENLRKKIEGLPWNFATLIAPTEATFKATRNYTTGSLFIVNNVLYKATANIANGATITPNSNCTSTTLAEIISALS